MIFTCNNQLLFADLMATAMCYADWSSDIYVKISTFGSAFYLEPNLITWWSRKQQVTARPGTETDHCSIDLS